jgi:hypothetical protein
MASAVVPVPHSEMQYGPSLGEIRAKNCAGRKKTRDAAARRVQAIQYPEDKLCFQIVHECQRLRADGYTAIGEIDDVVAATYKHKCAWLTGALVQDIVLHFAEQKVRELEAVRQLQLNTLDYMRNAGKETFQSAPGRGL